MRLLAGSHVRRRSVPAVAGSEPVHGMGHIEDDKAVCQGWKMYRELPGDGPTPVVTDDDGFVSSKMPYDGLDISYQVAHRVILPAGRFITQVVASQIQGDDLEETGQRDHLVAPGIPEVWEAMDHNDQWSLAYTGIVDVYSVIVRIMMCDVLVDVIGNDGGYCVLHLFPFTPFSL